MALHEALCKVLAALECGTGLRGADHERTARTGCEEVIYAGHERILVAYDNHIYTILTGKTCDGLEVEGRNRHILAVCVSAAVAGSDIKLGELGAL